MKTMILLIATFFVSSCASSVSTKNQTKLNKIISYNDINYWQKNVPYTLKSSQDIEVAITHSGSKFDHRYKTIIRNTSSTPITVSFENFKIIEIDASNKEYPTNDPKKMFAKNNSIEEIQDQQSTATSINALRGFGETLHIISGKRNYADRIKREQEKRTYELENQKMEAELARLRELDKERYEQFLKRSTLNKDEYIQGDIYFENRIENNKEYLVIFRDNRNNKDIKFKFTTKPEPFG